MCMYVIKCVCCGPGGDRGVDNPICGRRGSAKKQTREGKEQRESLIKLLSENLQKSTRLNTMELQ